MWQQYQRSNLTAHFQCRENYLGNEIWYCSVPSSPYNIQIWLLAYIWSVYILVTGQCKHLLKTPNTQLTGYWPQLSLHCRASSQMASKVFKADIAFSSICLETVLKNAESRCNRAKPDCWGAWPASVCSEVKTWVNRCERSGFSGVLLCYILKKSCPWCSRVFGGSQNFAEGRNVCDKQCITDTDCTFGNNLLPDQQPYAMLGTPKTFLSSWALGTRKRRHLKASLEPSSSFHIHTVAFSYSQQLQEIWFLVWQVLFQCA